MKMFSFAARRTKAQVRPTAVACSLSSALLLASASTVAQPVDRALPIVANPNASPALVRAFEERVGNDDQVLKRAVVRLDRDMFGRIRLPDGTERQVSEFGMDAVHADHLFRFNPFSDLDVNVVLESAREELGMVTWTGHVEGEVDSAVFLTRSDTGVSGIIETSDRRFDIRPLEKSRLGQQLHVVSELDVQNFALPGSCLNPDPVIVDQKSSPVASSKSLSSGELGLLVMYTSAVAAENDPAALVASVTSAFNAHLSASGISNGSLTLLHFAQVSYSESSGLPGHGSGFGKSNRRQPKLA